jgi:hypothetical protein
MDTGSTFHVLPHASMQPRPPPSRTSCVQGALRQHGASPAPGGAGRPFAGAHCQHQPPSQPIWAHYIQGGDGTPHHKGEVRDVHMMSAHPSDSAMCTCSCPATCAISTLCDDASDDDDDDE